MPLDERFAATSDLSSKITEAERQYERVAAVEAAAAAKGSKSGKLKWHFPPKSCKNGQQIQGVLGNQLHDFKGQQYIGISDGKRKVNSVQ